VRLGFGDVVVDLDTRQVWSAGREIRLPLKAFELLKLLLEHRPKALGKDDILDRLWPDAFVGENSVAALAAELRAALGDAPSKPRYIRTVYGFGYAFMAEVVAGAPQAGAPAPQWTLVHGRRVVALREGVNILGRAADGVIGFNAPTVSRHHARLTIRGARAVIEDLRSKNGTWVGLAPVSAPTPVRPGDEVRLGSLLVTLHAGADTVSTDTVVQRN